MIWLYLPLLILYHSTSFSEDHPHFFEFLESAHLSHHKFFVYGVPCVFGTQVKYHFLLGLGFVLLGVGTEGGHALLNL